MSKPKTKRKTKVNRVGQAYVEILNVLSSLPNDESRTRVVRAIAVWFGVEVERP